MITPTYYLDKISNNTVYIKRDDLIPYSFGGNKARKGVLFFEEVDNGAYDTVVTYGSRSSNHARIIANLAAERGLLCYIISPIGKLKESFNSQMMELFGATIIEVPVEEVSTTIEGILKKLCQDNRKPYFIQGGGHGNIGTQAYVDCYEEIKQFEQENSIFFDYIFHASGTGTTQAGLVCGKLIAQDNREIIGISIARKNPRGRNVVIQSVKDYFESNERELSEETIDRAVSFIDDYTETGYGATSEEITFTIKNSLIKYGIPMDSTYVAKAFLGMNEFLVSNNIKDKNILFIHTGGAPLFFNDLEDMHD